MNNKSSIIFLLLLVIFPSKGTANMINSIIEVTNSDLLMSNQVQGKMKINGETYTAICDCNPTTPEVTPKKKLISGPLICDPKKLDIKNEMKGEGASLQDIKSLVGEIDSLTYVQASYTSFRCLDGRYNEPVLAVPGGDAGEFITALSVFEDLINNNEKEEKRILNKEDIEYLFKDYLRYMKPDFFSMCTDYNAVVEIEKELLIEGLNIVRPRANLIDPLLNVIASYKNLGDAHLRLLLKYPELYGIRKELVEDFIRVFFKTLWNKEGETNEIYSSKINLDILNGEHSESAFVEVRSNDSCQNLQLAPLIKTKDKKISVFVDHLDAVSFLREDLAKFFSEKATMFDAKIDSEIMHKRLNHHGFVSLETTGSFIAKGLPFDTITLA